ncbi:MAG TPA: LEA type 2 family protein [Rhodanobacteraceae bacterium]|jgi:hypothetical protein|nr:LEA type 2 family protein [Rhodanobacteraceae bacterium]
MALRHMLAALAAAVLFAGCSSGPPKRITPSVVSIQQLVAAPDGQWHLTIRIQNYSTVAMHYSALNGTLHVAGVDVGSIALKPDLDIPPNSADVVETAIKASAKLPAGDLSYTIAGTLDTSEPETHFKFDRSSRLSPSPGLPGTWR